MHIGVKNPGESCWDECHEKEGKCKWCGPEGYCCQKKFKFKFISTNKHDVDCDGGAFGGKKQHECVPKYKEKSYHTHCHGNGPNYSMRIRDEYFPFPEKSWHHSNPKERQKKFEQLQKYLKSQTKDALHQRSFIEFMKKLMWPHNAIHSLQFCTMGSFATASYAPQFWLHHSFIDKIFSDWQAMPKREGPYLSETILDPFGDEKHNPFSLTRKTKRQAWDYKTNLCYRYDSLGTGRRSRTSQDSYQDPYLVFDDCKKHSLTSVVNETNLGRQYKEEKCSDKPKRIYKYKTYVGLVLPMHVQSGLLQYSIDGSNGSLGINVISSHNVALFGANPTKTK